MAMSKMPNITTAHLDFSHEVMHREWNRIKHDPSLRCALMHPEGQQCSSCSRTVINVKVCSACKMIIYCSPQCAKAGWKTHKRSCSAYKRDGESIPNYKGLAKQFPWTDIGYNIQGLFSDQFVLVQFGVLGTSRQKVGYWAFHEKPEEGIVAKDEVLDAPWCQLTEDEGWRLPVEYIPSLGLNACPSFPPAFEETWKSYYQWRELPLTSPAVMLLHWPMSVYACLKELGFVAGKISDSEPRRKLTIYYVGARNEICFIPIFAELALNFPNTDMDLVMFGPNASGSVKRANSRGMTRSPRPCVFEYIGPESCGGGTIRIFLDSDGYYCPSREQSEHPDAIVALNAGLGTYVSWQHVILRSFEFDIPFAVTDYSESCLAENCMRTLHQILTSTLPPPKSAEEIRTHAVLKRVVEEVKVVEVDKVCMAFERKRTAKFNEFMQPGIRVGSKSFSPGSSNACIQVITPRPK
ncbi:hypothetical protein C8R43DRAFT_1065989 [Mycena crocata]|nr:hypothetical protein C8R43DRAFT_1065989 [Mycena crocata]